MWCCTPRVRLGARAQVGEMVVKVARGKSASKPTTKWLSLCVRVLVRKCARWFMRALVGACGGALVGGATPPTASCRKWSIASVEYGRSVMSVGALVGGGDAAVQARVGELEAHLPPPPVRAGPQHTAGPAPARRQGGSEAALRNDTAGRNRRRRTAGDKTFYACMHACVCVKNRALSARAPRGPADEDATEGRE